MAGYFRYPTLHDDTVAFVAEDDIWSVPLAGGVARRLTSSPGRLERPRFSPDGRWLAFAGRDEGPLELYCMPAEGGPALRLTYSGGCLPAGWTPDSERVLFASSQGMPFASLHEIRAVSHRGGYAEPFGVGHAHALSFGPREGVIIARNGVDAARWKRYRGGTGGRFWIDRDGSGGFQPLLQELPNPGWPLWIGARIYFVSDHEGIGNLYSCSLDGGDLRRHTDHAEFYARNPTADGDRIVYHAGGKLFLFSCADDAVREIPVRIRSSRPELNRRFVPAAEFLEHAAIHPQSHSLAITTRGKVFNFGAWEGAVTQRGEAQGVRYREAQWSGDGRHLVMVADGTGEERIEILALADDAPPRRIDQLDLGLVVAMQMAPRGNKLAVSNNRFELFVVDIESGAAVRVDRSEHDRITELAWSGDGNYLCYGFSATRTGTQLKLYCAGDGSTAPLTPPEFVDFSPAFSKDGKYLFFLSFREFDPIYDSLHFELAFPHGARPYLIPLRCDLPSPFLPSPKPVGTEAGRAGKCAEAADSADTDGGSAARDRGETGAADGLGDEKGTSGKADAPLRIDLEGIEERTIAFPVAEARYESLRAAKGKVFYLSSPVTGTLQRGDTREARGGTLRFFDLEELREEVFADDVAEFEISADGCALLYHSESRWRLLPTQEPPSDELPPRGRKSGWIDLERVRVLVEPQAEWRQMYRETWRLMRENFWTADLSDVDWQRIHDRYLPLLDRLSTRAELSDLLWEMQGELGTSHAYEMSGDYRPSPHYDQGFLGADLAFDNDTGGYRIARLVRGDTWDAKSDSPLRQPGLDVREGDLLVAVGGRRIDALHSPQEALLNTAGTLVTLTIQRQDQQHTVTIRTLTDETPARYRQWVEANRRRVHTETEGRVGYVHVPDMGPLGYAEFHRYFLAEMGAEGLIVDARFNRGGHVSQLLLEKLARKQIGYSQPRWGRPHPYPTESIPGPIVAIGNEYAGSDGDIFCHCFKLMKLGKLIGTRTWGGVVGIWPRHPLVDGTVTTQPEFSFWFQDVGWDVEGHGTEPDIVVPFRPQEYLRGEDPQLARAIQEVKAELERNPVHDPNWEQRPRRTLPTLPPR
jgi:tricorn protease